jgi:hypothetical protein
MSDLLNKASLVVIPSGYKEDTVYSVVPSDGSGDLSFTRASNGTRINSAGLVEVCPWNLVEQSETFDNVIWGKEFTTITVNNITAPNGTLTADRFTLGVGTEQKFVYQLANQNGSYTQSVYLKKGTHTFVQLAVGGDVNPYCNFDLTNGTFSAFGSTATMTNVGDEWYRCTMTYSTSIGTYVFIFATNSLSSARTAQTSSTGNFYAWGAQLNIGSTAKPYFPTTDRLNVPRLTYQNGGGGCPSLLLEKQSTNLITYSEQFDNAAWSKSNVTITANNTTSPDGTQNADLSTATAGGELLQGVVLSTSTSYTFSFYVKKGTASDAKYRVYNFDAGVNVVAPTSYISQTSTSDWVRVVVSFTTGATGTNYGIYLLDQTSAGTMYFWGAQLEASSYPTSYIPTTSASATRVADACFKTGISSLIGQTEGVLFVDFDLITNDGNQVAIITSTAGNEVNRLQIYIDSSRRVGVYRGDASVNILSSAYTLNSRIKAAVKYKLNDYAFYINGVLIGTDTSASIPPTPSVLYLGTYVDQVISNQMEINQCVIFPTALTSTELIALTTI